MGISLAASAYLNLTGITSPVSAYPFAILAWIKPTTNGNQGVLYLGNSADSDYGRFAIINAANRVRGDVGGSATDGNAGVDTTNWQLAVFSCTSATSRVTWYITTAGTAVDTTNFTPTFANWTQIWIGEVPGQTPPTFGFVGDIAECHVFAGAGSDINAALYNNMVATPTSYLPENQTGWVDGWIFKDSTTGYLTSIGGTRTLTAHGSISTAAAHPFTRSGGGGSSNSIRNLIML